MEIPIEYDPDFGKIADESDLDESWKELARVNVNDVAELRSERIAELRRLLEESGTVVHPGDDWQMIMFLRAANCEPKKAFDVIRYFLEYRQYITKPLPSELRDLMEATKDLYCVLPHRDKHGRRVIWLKLWDPSKTKHDDMMCILYLVVLMLAREPKTQIAGISVISDQTGLGYSHMPSWRMIYSYQTLIKGGAPVVFHDSHVLNITTMFKYLMKLAVQLAPERITKNIRVHDANGVSEDLISEFGSEMLPRELGGNSAALGAEDVNVKLFDLETYFLAVKDSNKKCKK